MGKQCRKKVCGVSRSLTDLPNDIIIIILSFLTLREAGRTSLLSRSWRGIWKTSMSNMPDLLLDDINIMEENFPREKLNKRRVKYSENKLLRKKRVEFSRRVNLLLQSHQTPRLKSFSIRFHLSAEFSHEIDQWVQIAINKRAMKVEIDLLEFGGVRFILPRGEDLYTFPNTIFTTESTPFIKHLSLSYGIFPPLQDFSGFSRLIELRLNRVSISDEVVGLVLLNCLSLKGLSLLGCWNLHDLQIVGENLKYLVVDHCLSLSYIEIDADNLTTFDYYGYPIGLFFLYVPQLVNVCLYTFRKGILDIVSYALRGLSTDLPELETLLLHTVTIEREMVPAQLPSFSNLTQLILMVSTVKGSLFGFFTILQGAPQLELFELHLPFQKSIKKPKKPRMVHTRQFRRLEEVVFSGLVGSQDEIYFAVCLIGKAKGIKTVTILSKERYHHYDTGPVDFVEGSPSKRSLAPLSTLGNRRRRARYVGEQLQKVIPSGAQLIIN